MKIKNITKEFSNIRFFFRKHDSINKIFFKQTHCKKEKIIAINQKYAETFDGTCGLWL